MKIGVIVSTTRPTRRSLIVAKWFINHAKAYQDTIFDILDLKDIDLPFLADKNIPAEEHYDLESTKQWAETIKYYDGFVFIVAEYNNGYPAPLKNAIDTIYNEWDKKPVAFIGYGTYGASRAIEQLINITAKIGMVPLSKTTVGILRPGVSINDSGAIDEEYVVSSLNRLVDNLRWWAKLLKSARNHGQQ